AAETDGTERGAEGDDRHGGDHFERREAFPRTAPRVRAHGANLTTIEGGHHLDVEGLGHEIEGHRAREVEAPGGEGPEVAAQRLRVAGDVDDAAAGGEGPAEVGTVSPLPRRVEHDRIRRRRIGTWTRGGARPGGGRGVAAAALDRGRIAVL